MLPSEIIQLHKHATRVGISELLMLFGAVLLTLSLFMPQVIVDGQEYYDYQLWRETILVAGMFAGAIGFIGVSHKQLRFVRAVDAYAKQLNP